MIRTAKLPTERELIANLEATAAKLAGRAVIVRIRSHPGALGRAQKGPTGEAVIDLNPALFDPQNINAFAYTFAHEIAHVVKHFHLMPRRDVNKDAGLDLVKQVIQMNRPNSQVRQHETEADELARQWLKAVNENYGG